MQILTLENKSFNMDLLPPEIDDLRYAVLDNSDPDDPDYFFIPLIFIESFTAPAAIIQIGDKKIKMPLDWQILVGDSEIGDLEIIPLTSISERGFAAFVNNPLGNSRPDFDPVDIVDIYPEVKWYSPKMKMGHLLAVPLTEGDHPRCIYLSREVSRTQQTVKVGDIW